MPLWLGPQSQVVLLHLKIRPFLSHKRKNALAVASLKQALQLYGAGGWKDTDDLRMGASTEQEIRRVISEKTGGFLWWGTHAALDSWMINEVEIPTAIKRAKEEPLYPLVPIFVDLSPGKNQKQIAKCLKDSAEDVLGRNGVVRGSSEPADSFKRRIAARYVRDAVLSLPSGPLSVAIRALSEPSGEHDLTFDWRSVFGERSRCLSDGALPMLLEALANARVAFQAREGSPEIVLDADLPLPLAFLLGYEWRITTRIRLQVWQRTGSSYAWIEANGPTTKIAEPVARSFNREGPAILAVSCGEPMDEVALRYADEHSACELITLHTTGLLEDVQMRSIARETADQLRAFSDRGLRKHLLVKGPAAVATMMGAAFNACGPVTIPFWDGSVYVSPLQVGP